MAIKIKHLVVALAVVVAALVVGCGGGNLGLQNVNSTQVYTTGGYTVDTAIRSGGHTAPATTHP